MPAGGDVDVGVGNFGIILEYTAGAREHEAGFEVPEAVAVEIGACSWSYVSREVETMDTRTDGRTVPASQRRRHGSLSVFHFCHILPSMDEEGADIWG